MSPLKLPCANVGSLRNFSLSVMLGPSYLVILLWLFRECFLWQFLVLSYMGAILPWRNLGGI